MKTYYPDVGKIFHVIRTKVFEMSLIELEHLINFKENQKCSYSKWQRLEKGDLGTNFKQKTMRTIEYWSTMIIAAAENTSLIKGEYSPTADYKKKLFLELMTLLEHSQYKKYGQVYNFETINTQSIPHMIRFLTCIFVIFSGNHSNYVVVNHTNPTSFLSNQPAPFVDKVCTRSISPKYPELVFSIFDCRFTTPNTRSLPTDVVHTLEHFFSTYLREATGDLIDVSIMGCLTGFLMYFVGDKDIQWFSELFQKCLIYIMESTEIPKATPDVCWNSQNHDLDGAKLWAKRFLTKLEARAAN